VRRRCYAVGPPGACPAAARPPFTGPAGRAWWGRSRWRAARVGSVPDRRPARRQAGMLGGHLPTVPASLGAVVAALLLAAAGAGAVRLAAAAERHPPPAG